MVQQRPEPAHIAVFTNGFVVGKVFAKVLARHGGDNFFDCKLYMVIFLNANTCIAGNSPYLETCHSEAEG